MRPNNKSLREYITNPLSKENFSLTSNENMLFHWADFSLTCEIYRELCENDPKVHMKHNAIVQSLEKLKEVPVWVKTIDGVSTLCLYDIYEALATKGKLSSLYVNKSNKIVLSFMGPSGPFEMMSPSECVNPERYSEMIFDFLLKGKIPVRDFRLRTKGKVICLHGVCFNEQNQMNIEQITSDGILMSSCGKNIKENLMKSREIKLLINLKIFQENIGKNLEEIRENFSKYDHSLFFTRDSRCAFHVIPKNIKFFNAFDHDISGKQYIYIPFSFFKGHNDIFENVLREFINHVKAQIRDHIFKEAA